ncbi:MAG: osmotically inducible protein C [Desulfuromonas sp.]|nr:MAG: osmotically inducible protein C [Desulfuromonas sp.]
MKTEIESVWKGNLQFESHIDGHRVLTDVPTEYGGDNAGPSPKKLMLSALAGCTGVDVAMILKKMRVEIDDLVVKVEAEQSEETPSQYTSMHLIYEFSGKDLDTDKLKKAIELSHDKYCGVSMMYKSFLNITWEIVC